MSTLALMRWLESSPDRYDTGMRWLSLGRVARVHEAVARAAATAPGTRVLEIGCGTGGVTERLLERGARVLALDQSPEMLERARQRLGEPEGLEWAERTASEIPDLGRDDFDSVVLCLCLSDMSAGERRFVLDAAAACLAPGGRLVVADEVWPTRGWQRALQRLMRGPQWLAAWLLTGAVSRPVPDLRHEIEATGLAVESETRWLAGTLALYTSAPRPGESACPTG